MKPRLAIVGSGIAGLGAAYYLRDSYEITLFEKQNRLGGHTNTVLVNEAERIVPIDTGFMVFNHVTYPLLTKLFQELDVPTKKTDMSFSVQERTIGLEFAGASWSRLFGDRRNILNPRFWQMLVQLDRFNKDAVVELLRPELKETCIADFVRTNGYGNDFLNWYLIPMASSVWSTSHEKILEFPAFTLLQFFHNHGFLGMDTQHQWWTVDGGAHEYVKRLVAKLDKLPITDREVVRIRNTTRDVQLITSDNVSQSFDRVILACHADEALALLDAPTEQQRNLLSCFQYQKNDAVLHTDNSVMPRQQRCWSSWNHRIDGQGASTHYWMNSLQGVSEAQNYFVTINGTHLLKPETVLKSIVYHHPTFSLSALKAQSSLSILNRTADNRTFFCGSYFRYGFHEDALWSAHHLAQVLTESLVCT